MQHQLNHSHNGNSHCDHQYIDLSKEQNEATQVFEEEKQEQEPLPSRIQARFRPERPRHIVRLGKLWLFNSGDTWNVTFVASWLIFTTVYYNIYIGDYVSVELGSSYLVYIAGVFNAIFAYSFIKAVTTEPGVVPKGNILEDPFATADSEEKKKSKQQQQQPLQKQQELTDEQQQELEQQQKQQQQSKQQQSTANPRDIELTSEETIDNHKMLTKEKHSEGLIERDCQGESVIEQIHHNTPIQFYSRRYCNTCKIIRPPKTSHCPRCNHCVKAFDHHCFFIGNCVGARNYKYFVSFLASMTFLGLIWMSTSMWAAIDLFNKTPDFAGRLDEWPSLKYAFYFLCFLYVWGVSCGMHRTIRSLVQFCLLINITSIAYLCHDSETDFAHTPLCPLVFFLFNAPIASMVFPMCGTYTYNASRLVTVKEKSQLDAALKNQKYTYFNQPLLVSLKNLKDFAMQSTIPSEI